MGRVKKWMMEEEERKMEEDAARLKEEGGLKTFKVTERHIQKDIWIINAKNKEEAFDIAMSMTPDKSETVEVVETTVDSLDDDGMREPEEAA